jgi:hypothetical protein
VTELLTSVQNTYTIPTGSCCNFVDWYHGSALYGYWCNTGCKAHVNFTGEPEFMVADNICSKVKFLLL